MKNVKVKSHVRVLNGDSDFLTIKRVIYGKEKTPKELREYKILGVPNCPVGTVTEWKVFAKEKGLAGLRIVEADGSLGFDFV